MPGGSLSGGEVFLEIELCENSVNIIRVDACFVQPVKNDFFCAVFTPAFRTTLPQALHKTFNNRNRHYTAKQFKQLMTFDADDGMQNGFRRVKAPPFAGILAEFADFLGADDAADLFFLLPRLMSSQQKTSEGG